MSIESPPAAARALPIPTPVRHLRYGGTGALILALLSGALATAPLSAQEGDEGQGEEGRIDSPYRWREKGFRVGLFGGYHSANRGNLGFGQGPSAAGGAKLRLRISSPLSFEFGATYAPAERRVVDPREDAGPTVVDTLSAGWLRADIGAQLSLTGARTWNGIQPYAAFGAGFVFGVNEGASEVFADPALEPFRYDISTAPHVFIGSGFELFPSEKIGIGVEIRDYLIRLSAPDGFLLPDILQIIEEAGGEAPNASAWQHNLEFGIVLWYYF